jgi:NAD(P)-dependent dehydrogenase (short-subunit alcohol dehydrogenase family)
MLLQNFLLVLDTGRTGGIGFQSGLGIASQDASTTVVITGRNLERGQAAVERLQEESKTRQYPTSHWRCFVHCQSECTRS